MFIKDGIAYAGEQMPEIEVTGVRPQNGYRLWLRFNNGETRLFDFTGLLSEPAFTPLADEKVFADVYLDYGMPVWMNGEIDIAPEYLYKHSEAVAQIS